MNGPQYPLNVVLFREEGTADNCDCVGPTQLREWLRTGKVSTADRVFVRREKRWVTVQQCLSSYVDKSAEEQLEDMDITLTNLCAVAEQLKVMTGRFSSAPARPLSEHRKTLGADGNTDRDNDDNGAAVYHAKPRTGED